MCSSEKLIKKINLTNSISQIKSIIYEILVKVKCIIVSDAVVFCRRAVMDSELLGNF